VDEARREVEREGRREPPDRRIGARGLLRPLRRSGPRGRARGAHHSGPRTASVRARLGSPERRDASETCQGRRPASLCDIASHFNSARRRSPHPDRAVGRSSCRERAGMRYCATKNRIDPVSSVAGASA
jgi:hypothetical protein